VDWLFKARTVLPGAAAWGHPPQRWISLAHLGFLLSTDTGIATHFCRNCRRTSTGGADEQGLEAPEVCLV